MNVKIFNQILTSILVLALGAWAFYEYKKSQKEEKQSLESSSLLSQTLEDLRGFKIKKKGEELEVIKKQEDWFIKKPIPDLADFKEISRWFDEIKNQKVQKIQVAEPINWKNYHLDQAPFVEIEFHNGLKLGFSVSKKSSFDGKYFIKKDNQLLLAEKYLHSEINQKDFNSFRSKKLLPSLGHAEKIQWKGKNKLTLYWKDYQWSLDSQQKDLPLSAKKLDNFWTDLSRMEAQNVLSALSPSTLKKYQLNKASWQILVSYPKEKEVYHIKVSPLKDDKLYAVVSHRDFIFELSKDFLEILNLSKNDIRDHTVPFNYKKSISYEIKRVNQNKSFTIKNKDGSWISLEDKQSKLISHDKVEQFLSKIAKLEGQKYKKESKKESTNKDKKRIEIKDSKGDLIFELKEQNSDKKYSWLKTNLWPKELTAVLKKDIDEIFNFDIFQKESQDKSHLKQIINPKTETKQ